MSYSDLIWFHHHGIKMKVFMEEVGIEIGILLLKSSVAKLIIKRASEVYPEEDGWLVDWEVVQSTHCEQRAHGRIRFETNELKSAFGLSQVSGDYGDWLVKSYRADVAEQGKYIRKGDYLNIPCPGTGHDGDPNISIQITDEIKFAVERLITRQ